MVRALPGYGLFAVASPWLLGRAFLTGLAPVFRAAVTAVLLPVVFVMGDVDPLADRVLVAVADVLDTRILLLVVTMLFALACGQRWTCELCAFTMLDMWFMCCSGRKVLNGKLRNGL